MKKMATIFGTLFLAGSLIGCSGAKSTNGSSNEKGITLTYWTQTAETDPQNQWIQAAVKAFEAKHPTDKVKVVHQPTNDQFFSLFQSASIAKNGPDITDMWTGLYALRYKQFLLPLNQYLTQKEKDSMIGLQYTAEGFDEKNNFYGIVSELQSYLGYYNKDLFAKAGISNPPATYSEFLTDCAKLKEHGITPIADGGYMPFQEFSYYLMNVLTADQINDLRTGKLKWTDPKIVDQLNKYADIYKKGYTNPDVLSLKSPDSLFTTGKAAMVLDNGSWNIPVYTKALGSDKVGFLFIPQESGAVSQGDFVAYPGAMTSVTSYSKHRALAVEFIKDALDPAVSSAMAKAGLVPASKNVSQDLLTNPLQKELYEKVQSNPDKIWPMYDNLIQSTIADTMTKEFGLVITNKESAEKALAVLQQTWDSLPDNQKQ